MATRLSELRDASSRQLVGNLALLQVVQGSGAKPVSAPTASRRDDDWRKDILAASVDLVEGQFAGAARSVPDATKRSRTLGVAKRVAGLPGLVLAGGNILTADDKPAATAEELGGVVGGLVGGATPVAPILIPAGSYIGGKTGGLLYKHRVPIGDHLYRYNPTFGHTF